MFILKAVPPGASRGIFLADSRVQN
jgi:hypothetical protein